MVPQLLRNRRCKRTQQLMGADGYHRATHYRWRQRELSGYLAACNRILGRERFVKRGVSLTLAEDASRLGNPAREMLLQVATAAQESSSCLLVPQAPHDQKCLRCK